MNGICSLYFTQIALIQPDLLTSKPFVSQLSKTDVLFKCSRLCTHHPSGGVICPTAPGERE